MSWTLIKKGYSQTSSFPDFETERSLQREALNTNDVRNKIKLGLQLSAKFFIIFHLLFIFYFFIHYRNLPVINNVLTA